MKNLNTIIKLTCLVMFSMMSTVAFSQSNELIVAKKEVTIVANYTGLQSFGAMLNTDNPETIGKYTTELREYVAEATGQKISTVELDEMLKSNLDNYNYWTGVFDQLKVTNNVSDLYIVRLVMGNIKSQL